MILQIRYFGDPVLRKKAETIQVVDSYIQKLSSDLLDTMYEENGIGLAAPQVGVSKRMIAVDAGENKGNPFVLINPVILDSTGKWVREEGCLSFPDIYGNIERVEEATFQGLTIEGEEIQLHLKGLECRVMLHEIDHLDGILFIDKMSPSHKIVIKGKLKKLKKRTMDALKQ